MDTTQALPDAPAAGGLTIPGWLIAVLSLFVTIGLPLVLLLINARFLMTDGFLRFAYNSPIVPADTYGFSTEDRLELAPLALGYLFNDAGIEFLGDQTFPDGSPLYNERELSHMVDVKEVTQGLARFGYILIALVLASSALLAFSQNAQPGLYNGLLRGSVLTALLIIGGLLLVGTSFNWLFTQFHNLFFEPGTWLFLFTDTLIRLFPLPFWALAFALMFGGTLLQALTIGVFAWFKLR
jgi:integral membrane protein (TIGR01906 family)